MEQKACCAWSNRALWPLRGKGENWFVPALPSAVVCPSVISVVVARSGFLVIRSTIRNRREFAVRLALGASTERFKLLFRADLFNLFNHTNFSNPIATYTSYQFELRQDHEYRGQRSRRYRICYWRCASGAVLAPAKFLEQLLNYCGLSEIARSSFPREKTRERAAASVYTHVKFL
jgi:hypothetical protein